jgi:hypothetical protein
MKKIAKMTFTLKIKFDPPIPRIIDKPLTELDEDIDEAITNWFEDILNHTVIEEEFLEIDDITHIYIDNDIGEIEIFLKETPQTEEEMDQIRQLEQLSQDPKYVKNMLLCALLHELYIKWSSKQTRKKLFSIPSVPQNIDLIQAFNIYISVFVTEFTEKEFLNYIVFLNWFIKDDDALYNVMIMLVKKFYPFLGYQKLITYIEGFLKQRPHLVQKLKEKPEHDYTFIVYISPFQGIYLNQNQERDIKYFLIFYLIEYIYRQKCSDNTKLEDFYNEQKDKLIIQSINPAVINFQNTCFHQEHKCLITKYLEKHGSNLIIVSDLISTSIKIRVPDHVTDLEMNFIHNFLEQKKSEMFKEFAYMFTGVANKRELLFMCLPLKDSSMISLINRLMVINQKEDLEKYVHHIIKCVQEAIQAHHDSRLKKAKKYARKKEAEARKKALARKEKQERQKRIVAQAQAQALARKVIRPRSYSDPSWSRPTMASWHNYGRLNVSDIGINLEMVYSQALQKISMDLMQQYLEETVLVSAKYASAWLAFLCSHYNLQSADLMYQQKYAHMILWTLGSYGLDGAILTAITKKSLALVKTIYSLYDTRESPAGVLFVSPLLTIGYSDKDFYRKFGPIVPNSLSMCALVRVSETVNIGGYLCFKNIEFLVRFLATYDDPQERRQFMIMLPGNISPQYQATFGMGVNAYHIRNPERFEEWIRSRSKWFGLVFENPLSASDPSSYYTVEDGNRIYFPILALLNGPDLKDLPIPRSSIDHEDLASWITGMILDAEWNEEEYYIIKSMPKKEWFMQIIRDAFELFEEYPDLWRQKFQQEKQQ